jgi:hypothetical protein
MAHIRGPGRLSRITALDVMGNPDKLGGVPEPGWP